MDRSPKSLSRACEASGSRGTGFTKDSIIQIGVRSIVSYWNCEMVECWAHTFVLELLRANQSAWLVYNFSMKISLSCSKGHERQSLSQPSIVPIRNIKLLASTVVSNASRFDVFTTRCVVAKIPWGGVRKSWLSSVVKTRRILKCQEYGDGICGLESQTM